MKLGEMLTYFQMQDMLSLHNTISSHIQVGVNEKHSIMSVRVERNSVKYAKIMYRKEGDKVALIYADILFTGYKFSDHEDPDKVFIKNASITDIKNEFIGYD